MAKGDKKRSQNALDYLGNESRTRTQQTYDIMRGNHQRQRNVADQATQRSFQDYDDIYNRYKNFADTGGYSDDDIQNIRARATSPIRSIYGSARREMNRGQNLSGGYMPNKAAAEAKLARDMSYALSDKSTDANAQIAQMQHQGKLAGMAGMTGIYSATPGLSALHEGLYDSALNKELSANSQGNSLNMGLINAQNAIGQSGGGGILGSIGQIANIAKPFMSMIPGMGGGQKPLSSSNPASGVITSAPTLGGGGAGVAPRTDMDPYIFDDEDYQDYLRRGGPIAPTPNVTTDVEFGPIVVGPDQVAYPMGNGIYYSPETGMYYTSDGLPFDPYSEGGAY